MRLNVLLSAALLALPVAPALANPIVAGFNANSLGRTDDGFTAATNLGFSANFFGTTYTQAYVSNNGYLTFGTGQGNYSPIGLGASYAGNPIIAAFYDDVDTNNTNSGVVSYGTGTYAGRSAFGVNYPGVGYYNAGGDKFDNFQIVLVDRSDTGAGNFDIVFNYGSIQWDTSTGTGAAASNSAAVGYNAGTGAPGSYYQLPGSLVHGAFLDGGPNALATGTNDGTPGQLLFTVRNGAVVSTDVPEPASLALLGAGILGLAATRRRRT